MKKLILLFALLLFTFNSYSQFGIGVGYGSSKATVSGSALGGISISTDNISTYSLGIYNNSVLSDATSLEYGLSYGFATVDGGNSSSLGIPVSLKYYTGGENSGFHLIGGVGIGMALGEVDTDVSKKTSFSGGLGLGFDLGSNVSASVSYSTQLNNTSNMDGITIKGRGVGIGLKYWFK